MKCLGNGIASRAAPATNIFTNRKIVGFVSGAGRQCPHPHEPEDHDVSSNAFVPLDFDRNPTNTAEQLLCGFKLWDQWSSIFCWPRLQGSFAPLLSVLAHIGRVGHE